MISNEELLESLSDKPRKAIDILRHMIIFTPEESGVRLQLSSVYKSLLFSSPENEYLHLGRVPGIVVDMYGDEPSLWPEFVKIMMSVYSLRPCYRAEAS